MDQCSSESVKEVGKTLAHSCRCNIAIETHTHRERERTESCQTVVPFTDLLPFVKLTILTYVRASVYLYVWSTDCVRNAAAYKQP